MERKMKNMKNMRRRHGCFKNIKKTRNPSAKIYKLRAPNDKRTAGHGQNKTFATLQVKENGGNGQCLFLSILDHLKHVKHEKTPRTAADVRKAIVNYIICNWMDYAIGLVNYDQEFQDKLDEKACSNFFHIKKCQKMYETYMNKPTSWGTFVELSAATMLYGFKCVLLQVPKTNKTTLTLSTINYSDIKEGKLGPICYLLFEGESMAGHFSFLKPVGHAVPVPSGTYKLNTLNNVHTATLYCLNRKNRIQ